MRADRDQWAAHARERKGVQRCDPNVLVCLLKGTGEYWKGGLGFIPAKRQEYKMQMIKTSEQLSQGSAPLAANLAWRSTKEKEKKKRRTSRVLA